MITRIFFSTFLLLLATLGYIGTSLYLDLIQPVKAVNLDLRLGDRRESIATVFKPWVILADATSGPFCSGSVIDAGFIITAAHCISDRLGKPVSIYTDTGVDTTVIGHAAAINQRMDIGIITGNFTPFKQAKAELYKITIKMDKPLRACGNPYGQKQRVCTTIVPYENEGFAIKAKGLLYPGMSGGPVMDANGTIVGVNSAVSDGYVLFYPLTGTAGAFDIEPRRK